MQPAELREKQAPFKNQFKADPASALLTLRAVGQITPDVTCRLLFSVPPENAGLHPQAGGDGLAGCAGVTLGAVATAMEIPLRGGSITAEGDVDFRGTLGVSREVPIGFQEIRLVFDLDTDAPDEKRQKLIELTERYCVVYQTLKNSPRLTSAIKP